MRRPNLIPESHPRAESLKVRERLVEYFRRGVVVPEGLIAHGRGEAFDYILGEKTLPLSKGAVTAAAAALLLAEKPVISVNGNVAALAAEYVVKLAVAVRGEIEVNLFHRSFERERAVAKVLEDAGAKRILGVGEHASATIPELSSERRRVDPEGILAADVVLAPLEDGDRAEALVKLGKRVIAIDLNPLSRTAQKASITIVDNVTRALPALVKEVSRIRGLDREELEWIVDKFDNKRNLALCIEEITRYLMRRMRG